MKRDYLRQSTFYQHRYLIGLLTLFIFSIIFASYRFWILPGGLSLFEMASASSSASYSPLLLVTNFSDNLHVIVDLPWNVLQWISINLFGFSTFSMRLPAVVLMVLSSMGLAVLFKRWFRPNIAMIGGFLTITSVMFLSFSRSGSSASMSIFLIITAILAATSVIITKDPAPKSLFFKAVVALSLSLLMYSPGGLYLVVTLILAGLLHPKVRLLFVRIKTWKLALAVAVGLITMLPLILGIIIEVFNGKSGIISDLLVLNGQWSIANLNETLSALFGLEPGFIGGTAAPIISIVGLIILAIGMIKVVSGVMSARSYLVLPLLLVSTILSIYRPQLFHLLFVPISILTAIGIDTIISRWYSLFPRNPYARIFAILPLAVLVISLSWTSIYQFINAENYGSNTVYNYNYEFPAARSEIRSYADQGKRVFLVVRPDQQNFYELLKRDFPDLSVVNQLSSIADVNIVLASTGLANSNETVGKIVTNWHQNNSVLMRVYFKK